MASLGSLTLDLVAKVGGFTGPLEKARRQSSRQFRDMQKSAMAAAKGIAAITAAAAAAATGIALYTKSGMDAIDAQAKLARSLETTIGDLRGITQAASDAGVEQGRLESSLASMNKRLGDAARGTGEAQKAYKALGLDAEALTRIPLPERLALIAERINRLDTAAERSSIADSLMSDGRNVVKLFEAGGDAIRGAIDETEAFGRAISAVDASVIEAANDALSRIPALMNDAKDAVAVELAPYILVLSKRFNDAAQEAGGLGPAVREAVRTAVGSFGSLLDAYYEFEKYNAKGVVAVAELELGFAAFAKGANMAMTRFVNNALTGINLLIKGYGKLPFTEEVAPLDFAKSDYSLAIQSQYEEALGARNLAVMDMGDLFERGSLSAVFDDLLDDVESTVKEFEDSARFDIGKTMFKPLDGWLLKVGEASEEASKSVAKVGAATRSSAVSIDRDAERQRQAYQSLIDTLYPVQASARQFAEEQALLMTELGAGTDEYIDALERLRNSYRNAGEVSAAYSSRAVRDVDRIGDAADDLGFTFESAFESAVIGGNGLRDVLSGILDDIAKIAIREGVTKPLSGAISAGIGGMFGGGGGAIAGGFTSQVWTGQAHDGIHSVPASGSWNLQKGERVVTAQTSAKLDRTLDAVMRSGGGGGNTTVQIVDQRSGGQRAEVQETRGADGMKQIRVLIRDEVKAMHADGSMDSTLARNYGQKRRSL